MFFCLIIFFIFFCVERMSSRHLFRLEVLFGKHKDFKALRSPVVLPDVGLPYKSLST